MTKHHHISRHVIGGVALTNGVLLHTEDAAALAIRAESGEILTKSWSLPPEKKTSPFFRLFFVRGVWLLLRTIMWNSRMRQFVDSAIKPLREKSDNGKNIPQPHHIPTSLFPTIGFVAAFLLYAEFVLVSQAVRELRAGESLAFQNNVITVLIVLLLFVYVVVHGGVWRYMGYHGAEHQAIHAFEEGKSTEKDVAAEWPFQARCGAAVVSYVAILLAITGWIWPAINFWFSIILAIALFGFAYEIVIFLDAHSSHKLAQLFSLPGVALQFFVARHPDTDQSEVAARALAELLHHSRVLKKHSTELDGPMLT